VDFLERLWDGARDASLAVYILNGAYVIYTLSAMFSELLKLRVMLLGATVLYIAYGLAAPNWSIFFWNFPVAVLHIYAIWKIFSSRRGINLNEQAEAIRTLIFDDLDRVPFNTMWHLGQNVDIADEQVLIGVGRQVDDLMLILSGEVNVIINREQRVRLGPYRFIGEMSMLKDTPAAATVIAHGPVTVRSWNKAELEAAGAEFPELKVSLLKAMGNEVARKLS